MKFDDPHDPKYSRLIAQGAARINALEMPISKEPEWLFEMTESLIKNCPGLVFTQDDDIKRYQQLMSYNLENEFAQLR